MTIGRARDMLAVPAHATLICFDASHLKPRDRRRQRQRRRRRRRRGHAEGRRDVCFAVLWARLNVKGSLCGCMLLLIIGCKIVI